eukprot:3357294-Heterocapsa_arctica.AAC.2
MTYESIARFEILKSHAERQIAEKLWQGAAKEANRLAESPQIREADGHTLQAVSTTRRNAGLYAGARPIPFSPSHHPDVLGSEDVDGLRGLESSAETPQDDNDFSMGGNELAWMTFQQFPDADMLKAVWIDTLDMQADGLAEGYVDRAAILTVVEQCKFIDKFTPVGIGHEQNETATPNIDTAVLKRHGEDLNRLVRPLKQTPPGTRWRRSEPPTHAVVFSNSSLSAGYHEGL